MTLAERVKTAMERKTCDPRELAEAARIEPPSVHGWLNGSSHSMKAGPALRAAAYLGVSAIWLAEGEGPMLPPQGGILIPVGPAESASSQRKRALVRRVCDIAESINDVGLKKVIRLLDGIPALYPISKVKKKGAKAA